jgi:hypothetical protein
MCKKKVETYIYYVNICKHEHEKNMTRLWCKIVAKTSVEQTEGTKGSYSYLYPFGDLVQGSFQGGFMCASIRKFLGNPSNWESTMS